MSVCKVKLEERYEVLQTQYLSVCQVKLEER